jgi:hypothetical protein
MERMGRMVEKKVEKRVAKMLQSLQLLRQPLG